MVSKRKSESPVSKTLLCWKQFGWLFKIRSVHVDLSAFLYKLLSRFELQSSSLHFAVVMALKSPKTRNFGTFCCVHQWCDWLIKRKSYHHTETSQLICRANQLTGFYMMATLEFNELRHSRWFDTKPLLGLYETLMNHFC